MKNGDGKLNHLLRRQLIIKLSKTVLVTGASLGIGNQTARAFAKNGHNVIAVSRNFGLLQKLKEEFNSVEIYQLDVSDFEMVKEFCNTLKNRQIDVVVHNAGGGINLPGDIVNDKVESWRQAYDLNVIAPMEMTRLLLGNLSLSNAPQLVIVTSVAGHGVYRGGSNYTVAKHAEVALSKLLRTEFFDKNIRVTEISPGSVNSRKEPGRHGCLEPEDVANSILWASTLPDYVNIDSINLTHINNLPI